MFLIFLLRGHGVLSVELDCHFFTTERGYDQKQASRMIAAFALAMIAGALGRPVEHWSRFDRCEY